MIGIIYNSNIEVKMKNELSSLKFQDIEDIELVHYDEDWKKYEILIVDMFFDYTKTKQKIILILSRVDHNVIYSDNLILIQYESENIKNKLEEKFKWLCDIDSVVINCMPSQKLEIEPLDTQDATIFFCGKDKSNNMIDEMFNLDEKVHYNIEFYGLDPQFEPSKKHRLSWNVTSDEDLKGIIQYKIIREIENGCLPILLSEFAPKYFFAYPFMITLEELKDSYNLILRVKYISSFISKMTRDEFKFLANSMYNSIYINSRWNLKYYEIAEKIRSTIEIN